MQLPEKAAAMLSTLTFRVLAAPPEMVVPDAEDTWHHVLSVLAAHFNTVLLTPVLVMVKVWDAGALPPAVPLKEKLAGDVGGVVDKVITGAGAGLTT